MAEKRELTVTELLAADPGTLTREQIEKRVAIVQLRKIERELDLVEHENRIHEDNKVEAARRSQAGRAAQRATEERIRGEQSICRHLSGGKDRGGFFQGDGKWGYCVCSQILPTGEQFFLCMRCQKEWRLPDRRKVLNGEMSFTQYEKEVSEYNQVAAWPKPLFDNGGETPASCLFRIPALEEKKRKDDADWAVFMEQRRRAN